MSSLLALATLAELADAFVEGWQQGLRSILKYLSMTSKIYLLHLDLDI